MKHFNGLFFYINGTVTFCTCCVCRLILAHVNGDRGTSPTATVRVRVGIRVRVRVRLRVRARARVRVRVWVRRYQACAVWGPGPG